MEIWGLRLGSTTKGFARYPLTWQVFVFTMNMLGKQIIYPLLLAEKSAMRVMTTRNTYRGNPKYSVFGRT